MKFKVNSAFRDKKNNDKLVQAGDIIDVTEARAKEITKGLGNPDALTKIIEPKEDKESKEDKTTKKEAK